MADRSTRKSGLATWYRAAYFVNRRIDHFVLASLTNSVGPGSTVVDIGCGAQPYRRFVESLGGRYVGLDYSLDTNQIAQVLADVEAVPLADGVVDVVLCTELLEHVPHLDAAVAELGRIVRPFGGTVILTTPFMFGLHEQPFDFQRPTPHLLRRRLEECGMDVRKLERLGNEAEVIATTWETHWNNRIKSRKPLAQLVVLALRTLGNFTALALRSVMRSRSPHAYLTTAVIAVRE